MRKIIENVYGVTALDLPKEKHFVRDDANLDELLHVCERDLGATYEVPTGVLTMVGSPIWWDFAKGCYRCSGCKARFRSYADLFQIWQDGEGTGAEGHS